MKSVSAKRLHEEDGPETKGERSKRQIKQVIAKLAMTHDVADITLADICEAAGLTTGAVYFHFKNKDDAVEEMVIDEVSGFWRTRMAALGDAPLDAVIAAIVQAVTDYNIKKKRLAQAIQIVINARPRAYEAWHAGRAPAIDMLERAIAEARKQAGLSTDASRYLAYFVLGSIEDLAMDVFQWRNPTLKQFAATPEDWNRRQAQLWRWAILAPIDSLEKRKR